MIDIKRTKEYAHLNSLDYITAIFPDFIELKGDRLYGDDNAIIGGLATINGIAVTVIGQLKGRTIDENLKYNFSMSMPEGYRKSLRLMKQAEKFHRPIICFVDTVGAYPGKEAEDRGQAAAIANNLMEMMHLKTIIISILIGDGGSGGALALCVADQIAALDNAILSVISPKACAEILWKNTSLAWKAKSFLKISASDLLQLGVIDKVISIQTGENNVAFVDAIKTYIVKTIKVLNLIPTKFLVIKRNQKFRRIGCVME